MLWSTKTNTKSLKLIENLRETYFIDQRTQIQNHWCLRENVYDFVLSTEAADGMAPLGAMPSAASVMSKLGCHMGMILEISVNVYAEQDK